MSPKNRRKALLGLGLLSAVALLALVPAVQDSPADAPEPTVQPTLTPGDVLAIAPVRALPQAVPVYGQQVAIAHEAYLSDRVMIRPTEGQDPALIAADYGGELFRKPGKSGWVAISVPSGTHIGGAVETLRADPRIAQAGPVGIVRGAGKPGTVVTHADIQKPSLSAMKADSSTSSSAIVVAVIDSGVAYEDYVESDGTTHSKASTLARVAFPNPYDFVNDDAHPNDDHMHGTHLASLIASMPQSKTGLQGVAPGTSIMPIKVLDETNSGNEIDLIDGIWHAIDNGADVINLSLAFDTGYLPSPAIQDALRAAHEAEIIVVAAAGNSASDRIAWPAASSYTIAVASACDDRSVAPYSNLSTAVHVTGVGGCMDVDIDSNGYVDGLLGQTINPDEPGKLQYVLWAGTSQAAAMVSGTAARYLSDGASPDVVGSLLQTSAKDVTSSTRDDGVGAGVPAHVTPVLIKTAVPADRFLVSVLPYLHRTGATTAKPAAVVHVLDAKGLPAASGSVWISMTGSTAQQAECTVIAGKCHFIADTAKSLVDKSGDSAALGWAVEVTGYVVGNVNQIVEPAMFASDGLEILAGAMAADPDVADLPLGIYWPENATPQTGVTTSEAYAWVDSGVGFASSPLGVVLTPGNFPASALSTQSINLDGVGFSSSPLGYMDLTVVEFGGVGFASSPMGGVGFASSPLGLSSFSFAVMDGVGFASSPLGLDAFDIYAPGGRTVYLGGVGFSSSPIGGVGFASSPLNLSTGVSLGGKLTGSYTGSLIDDGGWTVGGADLAAGTSLIGANMVDMTPSAVSTGKGDGWVRVK